MIARPPCAIVGTVRRKVGAPWRWTRSETEAPGRTGCSTSINCCDECTAWPSAARITSLGLSLPAALLSLYTCATDTYSFGTTIPSVLKAASSAAVLLFVMSTIFCCCTCCCTWLDGLLVP